MRRNLTLLIVLLSFGVHLHSQVDMNLILIVNDTLQTSAAVNVEVEYKNGKKKKYTAGYEPGRLWITDLKKRELSKIKKLRFIFTLGNKTYEFTTNYYLRLVEEAVYFFDLRYFVLFFYDLKYFPQYKPQDLKKDYVIKEWYPAVHTILLEKTDKIDYPRK